MKKRLLLLLSSFLIVALALGFLAQPVSASHELGGQYFGADHVHVDLTDDYDHKPHKTGIIVDKDRNYYGKDYGYSGYNQPYYYDRYYGPDYRGGYGYPSETYYRTKSYVGPYEVTRSYKDDYYSSYYGVSKKRYDYSYGYPWGRAHYPTKHGGYYPTAYYSKDRQYFGLLGYYKNPYTYSGYGY